MFSAILPKPAPEAFFQARSVSGLKPWQVFKGILLEVCASKLGGLMTPEFQPLGFFGSRVWLQDALVSEDRNLVSASKSL